MNIDVSGIIAITIGAAVLGACSSATEPAADVSSTHQAYSITTQRSGPSRTGETYDAALDPTIVGFNKFGRVGHYDVDGFIYAQPLLVEGVDVTNVGPRNVLYVATNNNTLYAFDADKTNGSPLWQRSFGRPMDASGANGQAIGYGYFPTRYKFGIVGTPVIVGTTMYLVAEIDNGFPPTSRSFTHLLHAVDIRSGGLLRSAVISGTAPAQSGTVTFESFYQNQRPGLLAQNGIVYVAFGGNHDLPNAGASSRPTAAAGEGQYGWVFAYDAATLARKAVYCTTCSAVPWTISGGGAIWQAGSGLAGDGTNVFFMTGNGTMNPGSTSHSFVKLNATNVSTNPTLPASIFTVTNASMLNDWDGDLGSGGPILIPTTDLMVGGGKDGKLHLLSRTTMTETHQIQATKNVWQAVGDHDHDNAPHIHGSPVYWVRNNSVYVWGEKDLLRRYRIDLTSKRFTADVNTMPDADVGKAPPSPSYGTMPGGMLTLSVNPSTGNGIIWAAVRHVPWQELGPENYGSGTLRAIDALSMQEIWHAEQPFVFPKFPTVTVGRGRVFVPTFQNQVIVYGKLNLPGIAVTGASGWESIPLARSNGASGTFSATNGAVADFGPHAAANGARRWQGDFDGDGLTDVALTNGPGWQSIPIAYARGNGTYASRNVTHQASIDFCNLANTTNAVVHAGDFNGDGRTDLALVGAFPWSDIPVAFSERILGTFVLKRESDVGSGTVENWIRTPGARVRTGDFDGDGKTDFAVLVPGADAIRLGLSRGDGKFNARNYKFVPPSSQSSFTTADFVRWAFEPNVKMVVGDFNGDHISDIALTGGTGWTTVPVATSLGCRLAGCGESTDGGFLVTNNSVNANFAALAAEQTGASLLSGDFNGDGRTDLALVGGNYWLSIPVAFSNGAGTFFATNASVTSEFAINARSAPSRLVADMDGDGKEDIALTGATGWASVPVAFSLGAGTFRTTNQSVSSMFPDFSATAGVSRFVGRF